MWHGKQRNSNRENFQNSKSGFLVGDGLTWIDLVIADHSDVITGLVPGFLDGFPKVSFDADLFEKLQKSEKGNVSRSGSRSQRQGQIASGSEVVAGHSSQDAFLISTHLFFQLTTRYYSAFRSAHKLQLL